ncbi:Reverse transcriptase zinc-binding domain [Arabidopsis thaliana x Arabidopsis arenosa]|uniref:Reverse transcriptase zinc-binding domain n=1 Tax=Arabidopsis thaliana x Arabidopsis arenosa TaxID=1240361 RepID=A0A8T1XLY8_9BRAS|nr:Reverse transcriptase zinc-binding domain [Arabidopsis thaliana x Arabidopsis arenosa]
MPVYAMSCFKLPKTTCANLTSAMGDFWWNALDHKRKMHWVSWDKLCLSKEDGGLGFRDIECFNQALLAKQAWRVIQNPECLFAQVLKSRYFQDEEFLEADIGTRPSFGWRSIMHGRELLVKGIRKRVGNGKSISVWMDSWLYDNGWRAPFIKNPIINYDLKVNALIDMDFKGWNRDVLEEHFFPNDIGHILLQKPVVDREDFYCWENTKSGDYTVKTGYVLACNVNKAEILQEARMQPSLNGLKGKVWALKTAPKIKIFMWRALNGALAVADQFIKRGMATDLRCQNCGEETESINHILFSCSLARQVWALSGVPAPRDGFGKSSLFANFQFLFELLLDKRLELRVIRSFPWILWRKWRKTKVTLAEIRLRVGLTRWMAGLSVTLLLFGPPEIKLVVERGWLEMMKGRCWYIVGRFFCGSNNKKEAMLMCLIWALESLLSLKMDKIIFAAEAHDIFGAIGRPKAWPSLTQQVVEINQFLDKFKDWRLEVESVNSNRGTSLIAKSVISDGRFHDYIASGHPSWLHRVFEDERLASFAQ